MKVIFTTNGQSSTTYPLLKVAIKSLQKNTTLEPLVVWGDSIDESHKMIQWLKENEIEVISHQLSFQKEISKFKFPNITPKKDNLLIKMYHSYPDYYNQNFIQTESLRIDIPLLFPKERYVLYADCDVIFLKDIPLFEFKQPLAVAIRKYYINDTKFFNNGIMILNIPEMKKCYNDFKKFFIDSNYSFKIGDTTTQGAYNSYFQNNFFELPLEFNWHAFWYTNPNVHILHMCGPKPAQYRELYNNPQKFEKMYRQCILRKDSISYMLKYWNEYAETEDRVIL